MKKSRKIITVVASLVSLCAICAAITLCVTFPNKYSDELYAASDEFGLSHTLVRSVVWAESKFDKTAVSDKGACGLMQLMPETFAECANALRIPNADKFDPSTSLRCGCYYLSLMLDKFDGNEKAALMAYNAGEANARRFLAGEPIFPETEKYLRDIALAEKIYGLIN